MWEKTNKVQVIFLFILLLLITLSIAGTAFGTVTVYTSLSPDTLKPIVNEFVKKNPGIQVNLINVKSTDMVGKLQSEVKAGNVQCDVIISADPINMEAIKEMKILSSDLPKEALAYKATVRDPDNFWLPLRITYIILAYNESLSTNPPNSWKDLANPKYKGKIVAANPLKSGTMLYFFGALGLNPAFGWKFLQDLKANSMEFVGDNTTVLEGIVSGASLGKTYLLGPVLDYIARDKAATGVMVYTMIPKEGAIAIPGPIGICSKGPNPAGGKALVGYLLSKEGQSLLSAQGVTPAHPEAKLPVGMVSRPSKIFSVDPNIAKKRDLILENINNIFFKK